MRGDLDAAAESYRRALAVDPDFVEARGNLLFVHNYRLDVPQARMLDEARAYGSQLSARAKRFASWKGSANPARPLRIGFVSADLGDHPVGYFFESGVRELSRASLWLVAYPTHPGDDPVHRRLRTLFDGWRPIVGMSDEEAARQIHDDAVDILIDLSGHTAMTAPRPERAAILAPSVTTPEASERRSPEGPMQATCMSFLAVSSLIRLSVSTVSNPQR